MEYEGHKTWVRPSKGGRDKPFIAGCSCGWEAVQSASSASSADADAMDHLHQVSTGVWAELTGGRRG